MGESTRERISMAPLETGLCKFLVPPFMFLFGLLWSGGIIVGSWTHPGNPPVWVGIPLGLLGFGALGYSVCTRQLPLKVVWLEDGGVRLANFESELLIPYEAIARIDESQGRSPLVTIRLDRDSYYGRRFTFLSAAPQGSWRPFHQPADEGVAELRRRVDAARAGLKSPAPPSGPAGRSVMADRELDGPF